jgi:hypothetical protein
MIINLDYTEKLSGCTVQYMYCTALRDCLSLQTSGKTNKAKEKEFKISECVGKYEHCKFTETAGH